jgi:hypothetical protein
LSFRPGAVHDTNQGSQGQRGSADRNAHEERGRIDYTWPAAQTKAVIIKPDGRVQLGTQGEPLPPSVALAMLSKGEVRKVRKALREAGFSEQAGTERGTTD